MLYILNTVLWLSLITILISILQMWRVRFKDTWLTQDHKLADNWNSLTNPLTKFTDIY